MLLPLHLNAHADFHVIQRVFNPGDVGYETRSFVQVDPSNRVGDVLPEKRVIALAYYAIGVNGAGGLGFVGVW